MTLHLKTVDDRVCMFTQSGPVNGIFNFPVYFCPDSRLSQKQHKSQPTLLMCDKDWKKVVKMMHVGAFGEEYEIWTPNMIKSRGGDTGPVKKWVVMWKFPWKLNKVPGYYPIYNVPLPVGRYNFKDDGWWSPPPMTLVTESSIPRNDCVVVKYRTDVMHPAGPSVHHLENSANSAYQVAMISSQYFIQDMWAVTSEEKQGVVGMLEELYAKHGIYAFPCFTQQHAIVFYIDTVSERWISPQYLSRILSGMHGKEIQQTLAKYAKNPKALMTWANQYIASYGVPPIPTRAVSSSHPLSPSGQ